MVGIIFNDIHSVDLEVSVLDVTPAVRAEKRVTKLTIPGRDGTVTVSDGTYEDVLVRATLVINDKTRIKEIKDWLTGEGDLILYTDPEHKRTARVIEATDAMWHTPSTYLMDVMFECGPTLYEVSPSEISATDSTVTLYNDSQLDALPLITFDDTVVINGTTFTAASELTVDMELMVVYKYVMGVKTAAYADLTGDIEYMRLPPGDNTIVVTGTATIRPNWRWL